MIYIYALCEPDTYTIRYVGKSDNVKQRYSSHIHRTEKPKSHKEKWINKLLRQNLLPRMIILEEVNRENWADAERWWINYLRENGCNLTNSRGGGDGFFEYSPDAIKKEIETKTGFPADEIEKTVRKIRELLANTSIPQRDIAGQFGISLSTIIRIGKGETHKWVKNLDGSEYISPVRIESARGSLRANVKSNLMLDEVVVNELRLRSRNLSMYSDEMKLLALEFGTTVGVICNIRRGTSYKWLKMDDGSDYIPPFRTGYKNGYQLQDEIVRHVRNLYAEYGVTRKTVSHISAETGLPTDVVRNIISGKYYRDVD